MIRQVPAIEKGKNATNIIGHAKKLLRKMALSKPILKKRYPKNVYLKSYIKGSTNKKNIEEKGIIEKKNAYTEIIGHPKIDSKKGCIIKIGIFKKGNQKGVLWKNKT